MTCRSGTTCFDLLRRWHEEDRQAGCAWRHCLIKGARRSISNERWHKRPRFGVASRGASGCMTCAHASPLAGAFSTGGHQMAEFRGTRTSRCPGAFISITLFEQRRRPLNAAPGLKHGRETGQEKRLTPVGEGSGRTSNRS